jgi:hypothetical protein
MFANLLSNLVTELIKERVVIKTYVIQEILSIL